jgi:serine/threonine-protein kinase RsbT
MDKTSHEFNVSRESDIANAAHVTMAFCRELGFSTVYQSMIATSVSELASNIVKYATRGFITIARVKQIDEIGIEVVAEDHGPGIKNRALALKDNYSTGRTLGVGLPGVRRMMDEFMMDSAENYGTKIVARKWKPK